MSDHACIPKSYDADLTREPAEVRRPPRARLIWKEYHLSHNAFHQLSAAWQSSRNGFGSDKIVLLDEGLSWILTNLPYHAIVALARMARIRLPEPLTMTTEQAQDAWEELKGLI